MTDDKTPFVRFVGQPGLLCRDCKFFDPRGQQMNWGRCLRLSPIAIAVADSPGVGRGITEPTDFCESFLPRHWIRNGCLLKNMPLRPTKMEPSLPTSFSGPVGRSGGEFFYFNVPNGPEFSLLEGTALRYHDPECPCRKQP